MKDPRWPDDDLPAAPWLRRVSNIPTRFFIESLWGLKISGLENIPERGPVIISANHISNFDGPVLAIAVGRRRYLRFLAKIELFRVPLLGSFLRRIGTIPLDRKGDVRALRTALEVLEAGGCLNIMPEGTRSKTGEPGRAKAGLGFFAAASSAPVVPARIVNTNRYWRLKTFEVRFGAPMRFEAEASGRAECLKFAQDVLDRVFTL